VIKEPPKKRARMWRKIGDVKKVFEE
jgi:hypothetical protein